MNFKPSCEIKKPVLLWNRHRVIASPLKEIPITVLTNDFLNKKTTPATRKIAERIFRSKNTLLYKNKVLILLTMGIIFFRNRKKSCRPPSER